MERSEYIRRFNDLTAAVSDSSREEARHFMQEIRKRCLEDFKAGSEYNINRLIEDLTFHWYETYRRDGKGPWLPKESAGIK